MNQRAALLAWYDAHARALPWRSARPDPYHVLVSELMLQQTTVESVKPRFADFIQRFATISALAAADLDEVLHAWQGLGYYRRARSLHAAARAVCAEHGGSLPASVAALASLPGIGRYTAAAIAAIAFGQPVVPVDGNIARIVARLQCLVAVWPNDFAAFQDAADDFAGAQRPGDVAQALMDLGATICRPRAPKCRLCPLAKGCQAHATATAEDYPHKRAKQAKRPLFAAAFLVRDTDGRIQFRKRPETGLLGGLIELPTTPWQERPFDGIEGMLAQAPAGIVAGELSPAQIRHVFTHIDLRIALVRVARGFARDAFWHPSADLSALALPTLTRKLLEAAGMAT